MAENAEARHTPSLAATVTVAPLGLVDALNLLDGHGTGMKARAESEDSALAVTIAPNDTCGYVNGDKDSPVTCANSDSCSWAVSSGIGLVACGSEIYVSCLESSNAVNSTRCDDLCQSNTFNLLCTDSDQPFCRTYVYPSGIFDYRCASTTVEELERVDFTYEGQKSSNFTTTTLTDDSEGLGEPVTVTVEGKATEKPSAVTIYMIPQPPSSSTTSSIPTSSSKKSTPVGPIVGGVVGGVVFLGLIALGSFCLIRRQRKNRHQKNMAHQPHQMHQNQYPYNPYQQGVVPPYTDPSMISSMPVDGHMSMMRGSVSPGGQNAAIEVNHLSPSAIQSPAPAYEMDGSEARESGPVHEMGADSLERK
ncbi:hypothetical protein FBEOM_4014 [Fusarium beomiforme]|uniref:Uncharacterized protein n=1 Tax=Fusarium beomiforme TaxID=44412 RepID=A0A9P5AP24_9HYPO|nr:hypothetical protein FBEOM_4014 [Fusarium beomiforme]